MDHIKVKNSDSAWHAQDIHDGKAHGWIQWKGTDVCMDVHCKCGSITHIDGFNCYHVKCSDCGTVYFCNGHIEFIEIEDEPTSGVLITISDD